LYIFALTYIKRRNQ